MQRNNLKSFRNDHNDRNDRNDRNHRNDSNDRNNILLENMHLKYSLQHT